MTGWPIFVLSLDDARDRRSRIAARLGALGLPYEIVTALDGRTGLPDEYEALVDRERTRANLGRDMASAEYACAISHHLIYRRIGDEGLPGVIVLEDDAVISPLFGEFVAERGFEKADLIALDHWFARVWRFSRMRLTPHIRAGKLSRVPSLTTGYSISASGCRYLLENSLPISRTADWPCDITRIDARATIPRIVDHPPRDPQTSVIERQRRELARQAEGSAAVPVKTREARLRQWLVKRASTKIS